MADAKSPRKASETGRKAWLNLVGFKKGDERPNIIVAAVDRTMKPIHVARVDSDGNFDLPASALKEAHRIIIGPDVDNLQTLDLKNVLRYRPNQFAELLERGALNIPGLRWETWLGYIKCVTGSVRHCRPFPPWWLELQQALTEPLIPIERLQPQTSLRAMRSLRSQVSTPASKLSVSGGLNVAQQSLVSDALVRFPWYRCDPVCIGTVEVYQRRCCCRPWIIDDIVVDLEDILDDLPIEVEFPPIPIPWPDPPEPWWFETKLFTGGVLNEKLLNARRDLNAIRSLPRQEAMAYIDARPYLWHCTCGGATKVAEGFINPDATFNLCWFTWSHLLPGNCHYEYAYVVKQQINGMTVVIYNGLAANQWFNEGVDAELVSYHPQAIGCPDPGQGVNDAAVYLDTIGGTESWNLATPNAAGWDRVAMPAYNSGLVFPAATDAAAAGQYLNCNWGGTLVLRYMFTWQLKATGAKYYRISWIKADGSGNPDPSATREYFTDGLVWKKYESFESVPVTLGPNPVGGENYLYEIPYYDGTINWTGAVTHHGYIDTTKFADGRYLVTVEIFDAAGKRLKPTGTPSIAAGDIAKSFHYLRWYQDTPAPGDDFSNVPYAALTHLFWWDNRAVTAKLVSVYMDGAEFNEECMFLEGTVASTVALAYRAYHPNPRFHHSHGLGWRRGFGSFPFSTGGFADAPADALGVPLNVHGNVGTEPGFAPGVSGTQTFGDMLRPDIDPTRTKCTFTVTLSVQAKTTNGSGFVLPVGDYGSFALEIMPPGP
ncbi:MAG: hypothetical protein JNM70_14435 [Anaerolineae bacterium]|nr:hypothetical protein [Anaerolineae bacterium]